MRQEFREKLLKGKEKAILAGDRFSIIVIFIQPILLGVIFFRVWYMKGAPTWYYVINGLMFIGALGELIYFIFLGLFPAIRSGLRNDDQEEDDE